MPATRRVRTQRALAGKPWFRRKAARAHLKIAGVWGRLPALALRTRAVRRANRGTGTPAGPLVNCGRVSRHAVWRAATMFTSAASALCAGLRSGCRSGEPPGGRSRGLGAAILTISSLARHARRMDCRRRPDRSRSVVELPEGLQQPLASERVVFDAGSATSMAAMDPIIPLTFRCSAMRNGSGRDLARIQAEGPVAHPDSQALRAQQAFRGKPPCHPHDPTLAVSRSTTAADRQGQSRSVPSETRPRAEGPTSAWSLAGQHAFPSPVGKGPGRT